MRVKNTEKYINSFDISLLKNMFISFIRIQYLMSFLCVIVITGCKELTTFSSCNSLLFRPATIIFIVKSSFSLSPKFWGVRKQLIFPDATTGFPRNDV